jgi:hypothetical protein
MAGGEQAGELVVAGDRFASQLPGDGWVVDEGTPLGVEAGRERAAVGR